MNALQSLDTQIPVFGDETDDAAFLEIVSDTVNGMLLETKVAGVSFVKIRDWFGPKWLGFSGKKMGAFGVHDYPLNIPPFNPNRVLSQRFYVFSPDSMSYERNWPPFRLHPNQPSEENFHRYFARYVGSGAFIWYSSDSTRTGNGALMIYLTRHEKILSGYLGLERASNGEWKARSFRVEGRDIPLELFKRWQESGRTVRLSSGQ